MYEKKDNARYLRFFTSPSAKYVNKKTKLDLFAIKRLRRD